MRLLLLTLALSFAPSLVVAADAPSETARGDTMLRAYFRTETKRIADADLADVKTLADWETKRAEYRREFLDMLGLWPLPARTDLHATITGTVDTDLFTVEKLHFQSRPGLYVTANLYVPKRGKFPVPAVLYVCGHSNTVIDKVSYGSKVSYQRHAAWFAEHGYVCLVLDTLELGEIPGEHHGTYRRGRWWWQALGYTPAGVECWNAMRALDYLESRKEVDAKRLGVTGRSGGGATSWWIAAADERIRCAIPVAGLADLHAHVVEGLTPRLREGVIAGHCDCMYFVNTYRWDFGRVIALCAPRPVLLGNSDADDIFPVEGYRRPAAKARRIYDLYGAADRFALLETKGPHNDTPELRHGAYRWMNRWLKDDANPIEEREVPPLKPQQLKVFDQLPADSINATIDESFIKPAKLDLPQTPEAARAWLKERAPQLKEELRRRVFHGWPDKPPPLNARLAKEIKHEGLRLRAYDYVSEENVELRLWILTGEKVEKPDFVRVRIVDDRDLNDWAGWFGPAFAEAFGAATPPANNPDSDKPPRIASFALAVVAPRGIGPTRWAEKDPVDGKSIREHVRRRFPLLGQTLDGQRVWDVRRALACLRTVSGLKNVPLYLNGAKATGGIALAAAIFEPDVAQLELREMPHGYDQEPIFLNVLRVLDAPRAVALCFPRRLTLFVKDDDEVKAWQWPIELQKMLGKEYVKVHSGEKKDRN